MLETLFLLGLLQTTTVKNPTSVEFTCPDHAQDSGHEIDIINASGVVIQTLQAGDPAADSNGVVKVSVNVQPVQFGSYTVVVRATFSGVKSSDSPASDVWERVPGAPSKPVVK